MSEEQKDNVLIFLECNTEELAGLPNGRGVQAVANTYTLLDYLPTLEPNTGANSARIGHRSADKVASGLLVKFENFSDKVKDGFKFIEEFKMKYVGMTELRTCQLLLLLVALQLPHGSSEKVSHLGMI